MLTLNYRFCILILQSKHLKKAGLTKSISVNPLCILLSEHDYGDFDE